MRSPASRLLFTRRTPACAQRVLQKEDFNDDKKDAGEMGAGQSVTALYEIVLARTRVDLPAVDPLKYQREPETARASADELMTVKVRYKDPDGGVSRLMSIPVRNRIADVPARLGFAASVAEFGMLLRDSEHKGSAGWRQTADLARRHRGEDPDGTAPNSSASSSWPIRCPRRRVRRSASVRDKHKGHKGKISSGFPLCPLCPSC